MREKKKYLEGTKKIIDESRKENKPYYVNVLGKKFIVFPNVFSPKYFFDTEFFAKEIKVSKDDEFLEIGPGSGAVSVSIALQGPKRVVAVDINPDAVACTKENAKIHKVEDILTVYQGDLYSPLNKADKFDFIFLNTPFGYTKTKEISTLEKAVFDPLYKSTKKFIAEAKNHLKKDGKLLIGFSSTLGHMGKLKEIVEENGYKLKLLKQIESVETHPVKFELFEAVK